MRTTTRGLPKLRGPRVHQREKGLPKQSPILREAPYLWQRFRRAVVNGRSLREAPYLAFAPIPIE